MKFVKISRQLIFAYTIVQNLLCKLSWNQDISWRLASLTFILLQLMIMEQHLDFWSPGRICQSGKVKHLGLNWHSCNQEFPKCFQWSSSYITQGSYAIETFPFTTTYIIVWGYFWGTILYLYSTHVDSWLPDSNCDYCAMPWHCNGTHLLILPGKTLNPQISLLSPRVHNMQSTWTFVKVTSLQFWACTVIVEIPIYFQSCM